MKIGQARQALHGFDPEWDLVIFDAAGVPHPPRLVRPSSNDIRRYRRMGTLEIAPNYVADNGHLVVLTREEFIFRMAQVHNHGIAQTNESSFRQAEQALEVFLEKHRIVYGHPSFFWDVKAAWKMVKW